MLFNSIDFAIFLPIVFFLYWFIFNKNNKIQNLLLVISSLFFYGWWDWKFLLLMCFTILCSWVSGLIINKIRENNFEIQKEKKLTILTLSSNIVLNLLILGFFKYYNFFVESFTEVFALFGNNPNIETLNIILPVGISFYTFQALSYSIDVYRKKIETEKNLITFTAFVSFFPQLVAGPIERASNLIPQFQIKRSFDSSKAVDGLRQILWGLLKKVVIADNCATIVNNIYANYEISDGSTLLIASIFFTFQIYGDFSGYSDIAIGTARLFGINLMQNFNYPFFSRNIAEFWRRWHISLTTWFRDYIYISLGGSKNGKWKMIRNTFIIFLISGFWHGANWTFVAWGAYHAILFLPLVFLNKNRTYTDIVAKNRRFPNIKELVQMLVTSLLVALGLVIFRSDNITNAYNYFAGMMNLETLTAFYKIFLYKEFWFCLILIIFEWLGRKNLFAIESFGLKWKKVFRISFYIFLVFFILLCMKTDETPFIYFQF